MSGLSCPALLVAAPASGAGKTTVTAALARWHARRGRRVTVFKCGPDFLDPQIHEVASGRPCQNLDLGMCGEADARWRLARAAATSDLILVEGVMGLFDGVPSAADIALRFGIPVMAVIDAGAMAQTFGAVAHGLGSYRPGLPFTGALANRVAGPGHADLLAGSLPSGIGWFGALPNAADSLPERQLGLLQPGEIDDLAGRLDRLADALAATAAVDLPKAVIFEDAPAPRSTPQLAGKVVAIARDAAYAFIYPANLETLRQLGAELRFFSPLAGESLPACDAIWLPGGYPELHAAKLAANGGLRTALQAHVYSGKPLLAECGGMMSLFDEIVDQHGIRHHFAGLLPGRAVMQPRLAALGTQFAELPEGRLAAHTFHYSRSETPLAPLLRAHTPEGRAGEAVFRQGRLTASYLHFYFPSNPGAVAALFA
ncbi:MAG: cobyrinate a,c-diamide synthase [Betaproteobacteria bacterium]|nr:cobyrinate a,c-diamide synthase [Betaproteobacteria bacterium]